MIAAPRWQAFLFGAVAGLALALQIAVQPDLILQLLLLAPLVAILGLPHGALDLPIAEALWPLDGWRGKLRFMAIYLGLVACVVVIWILFPSVALVAFLAYSVLHFSDDWSKAASPLRWTGGVATIGAPAVFYPEEVTTLFAYLAPPASAEFSANVAAVAGAFGFCVFIGTFLFKPNARSQATIEQAILWGIGALLPPLLFFTVYFCGLHSVRHFNATIQSLPCTRRALGIAASLSGLVILAAVVLVQSQVDVNSYPVPENVVQVIFVGLAALTVPHMILIERFNQIRLSRIQLRNTSQQ